MTADEVRDLIRERCREAGSQKAFAEQIGVTPQYITDILGGARDPSAKICEAIGLTKATVYQRGVS